MPVNMSAIEISVVIPTYNRREILRSMLGALREQTISPQKFEVIVVVDGATDGTWEMLQEIETPYRLTSHYQENAGLGSSTFSSGVSVARNRGAALAEGHVLLFLDDDLIPLPGLVEEHARIHRHSQKAVVLGRLLPSDETTTKRGWNIWEERTLETHYRLMARGNRPPAGWRLYSANFSVERQQFVAMNGFDVAMGHVRGEDVDLGLRLEDAGATFHFVPAAGAIHLGFRNFSSWCNSAYILGVRDVVLAEEKGRKELMQRVYGRRRRRPRVISLAVRLSLGGQNVRATLVGALRFVSGVLERLKLRSLAHAGYSIIFHVHYWNGIAEGLRGRVAHDRPRDERGNGLSQQRKLPEGPSDERCEEPYQSQRRPIVQREAQWPVKK